MSVRKELQNAVRPEKPFGVAAQRQRAHNKAPAAPGREQSPPAPPEAALHEQGAEGQGAGDPGPRVHEAGPLRGRRERVREQPWHPDSGVVTAATQEDRGLHKDDRGSALPKVPRLRELLDGVRGSVTLEEVVVVLVLVPKDDIVKHFSYFPLCSQVGFTKDLDELMQL